MKHRYIKWTVMVLAVEVAATFGLNRSFGAGSNEDGPYEGQGLREVQGNPTIIAPTDGIAPPTQQTDNQPRVDDPLQTRTET